MIIILLWTLITAIEGYKSLPSRSIQIIQQANLKLRISSIATEENDYEEMTYHVEPKRNNRIRELRRTLAKYGSAGLLSYGTTNLVYYTTATLVAVRFAPVTPLSDSTKSIFKSASAYIAKLAVYVWAGSQVSKPFRLWGAVCFAPQVERLMGAIKAKWKLQDGQTFWLAVTSIWGAFAVFYAGLLATTLVRLR